MKIRLSIARAIVAFGLITAAGLAAMLLTSNYALNQLRVGGPLYTQIKLGNDLVADILPPPAYVVEAYLEATLALQEPKKASAHKERLAQLQKEFNERQEFWQKSDLEAELKTGLTVKSYAEVKRFWSLVDNRLLPGLAKGNQAEAAEAYGELT